MDSCQWYMGCGRRIVGLPSALAQRLGQYERSHCWRAEPKLDGWWLCVTGRGPGRPPHCVTRTGRTVDVPRLAPLDHGLRIVGELMGGRESGTLCVFDVLSLSQSWCTLERKAALRVLFRERVLTWPYAEVPWQIAGFVAMFDAEPEGIILKRWPGGPYVQGKTDEWIKVKRARRYDVKVVALAQGAAVIAHLDGRPAGKVDARGRAVAVGQVVEVQAYKLYPSGRFKSPVIKRIRAD